MQQQKSKQEQLEVQRVRHPIVVRALTVDSIEKLAEHYVRIRFVGPDLAGFTSSSFDDHIKMFFPEEGTEFIVPELGENGVVFPEEQPKPAARDYTPRAFSEKNHYLEVDFVLHDHGPAGVWAQQAKAGDQIAIAGPRGSMVIPMEYDWHLLVGDETALPAIIRRLHELPAQAQPIVVLETTDPALKQLLPHHPNATVHYLHRENNQQPSQLPYFVEQLVLPTTTLGFAWVAAESSISSAVRNSLFEQHQLDKSQVKAASYWRQAG